MSLETQELSYTIHKQLKKLEEAIKSLEERQKLLEERQRMLVGYLYSWPAK